MQHLLGKKIGIVLFGFSVLVLCVLPGDVLSKVVRDIEAEVREYGIFSPYCQKSRNNAFTDRLTGMDYPPTPVECCSLQTFRCKNYIKPGETKFNLKNTGLHPIRDCECERKMLLCLQAFATPEDWDKTDRRMGEETCLRAIGRHPITFEVKYKICAFRYYPQNCYALNVLPNYSI